jgi:hypothetical protein
MSFEPYLQLLNGSGRKHTTIPADLAPISSDWGSRESCSSTRWRIFHAGFVGWSAERSRSSNERLSWDVAGCREWARQLESSAHPNRFSGRAAPRSRRLGSRRELPSVRLPYLRILPRHLDPFTASVPPFSRKGWVSVLSSLYDVERVARDLSAEARRALREEQAAPLLAKLQNWLDTQQLLPKSLIGQAATYTRNQWAALNRYLEDGDLSIDNNLSERKNWLFVGSQQAGERSARLMSLIASCKHNRVEPWAYLRDLFTRLPAGAPLETFLPDRWLADHPQHRWAIADHREQERAAKAQL